MNESIRRPPSDKALAAVGDAITSWSALEQALTQQLVHLVSHKTGTDEGYLNAFLLVAGMSTETMLGLLKTLVRIEFPEAADDFDKLAVSISKAAKNRRNVVAHKVWGAGSAEDKLKVWDIKTVGTFRMERYEITANELGAWAHDFRDFGLAIEKFFVQLGLPPLTEFLQEPQSTP